MAVEHQFNTLFFQDVRQRRRIGKAFAAAIIKSLKGRMVDKHDAESAAFAFVLKHTGQFLALRIAEFAGGHEEGFWNGAVETNQRDLAAPPHEREMRLGVVIPGHEGRPGCDRLLERARHIGVVIARDGGYIFRLAEAFQKRTGLLHLCRQSEVGEVARDRDMVRVHADNCTPRLLKNIGQMDVSAPAHPVQITGHTLGEKRPCRQGRQRWLVCV